MKTMTECVIPRDGREMVRLDMGFIQAVLNKIDRGASRDDVFQHIIMKLLEVDIVGKFQAMVAQKLPLVMTAEEACGVLGIKFAQWRSRQHSYRFGATKKAWGAGKVWKAKWAPDPVDAKGERVAGGKGYAGRKTLYLTLDIVKLYEAKGFRCLHFVPKQVEGPVITGAQWRGYLKRAVHNHWANYCRTQSRRHKERPVAGGRDGDDADLSLEATLSCDDSIEARVDIQRMFARTAGRVAGKGQDFLDLVTTGYTGQEALEKLGYSTRQAVRLLG